MLQDFEICFVPINQRFSTSKFRNGLKKESLIFFFSFHFWKFFSNYKKTYFLIFFFHFLLRPNPVFCNYISFPPPPCYAWSIILLMDHFFVPPTSSFCFLFSNYISSKKNWGKSYGGRSVFKKSIKVRCNFLRFFFLPFFLVLYCLGVFLIQL